MTTIFTYLISLAGVYLLLSTIVSSFLEFWNVRVGKNFRKVFLREMLEKTLSDEKSNLVAEIYRHPLIAQRLNGTRYMPSAIDTKNFADALFAVVSEKSVDVDASPEDRASVSAFEKFKSGIGRIPSYTQQQLLYALLPAEKGGEANPTEAAKANIAEWFDAYMARISGEYKRRQRKPLFWVSFLLALLLNVNGLTLFRDLWHNQNLQKTLETQITALAETQQMPTVNGENPIKLMDSLTAKLNSAGLPFGYDPHWSVWKACYQKKEPFENANTQVNPQPRQVAWNYLKLIAGYILAAVLMSMGAPFWWEAINKFINLRSVATVKK